MNCITVGPFCVLCNSSSTCHSAILHCVTVDNGNYVTQAKKTFKYVYNPIDVNTPLVSDMFIQLLNTAATLAQNEHSQNPKCPNSQTKPYSSIMIKIRRR
jgi:hypothetical protein